MTKKVIWKFTLTAALVLLAVYAISPLEDQDFEQYMLSQVTAELDSEDPASVQGYQTFAEVIEESKLRMDEEQAKVIDGRQSDRRYSSLYVALKSLGEEEALDYAAYFLPPEGVWKTIVSNLAPNIVKPGITTRETNRDKRNVFVLQRLLSHSKASVKRGLDLKGGVAFTLELDDSAGDDLSAGGGGVSQLDKVIEIMNGRLNSFGLAETVVRKKGERAVEIQIPDLSTKENPQIIEELQRPALLEFKKVLGSYDPAVGTHSPTPQSLYDENGKIREIKDSRVLYVAMSRDNPRDASSEPTLYFVKKYEEATGSIIETAYPSRTDSGGWEVAFDFTDEGRKEFARITGDIAGDNNPSKIGMLAVVLDGKLESSPTVKQRIDSKSARIEGNFSYAEAKALADILNNPLEIPLKIGEMYEVAGTLADDALSSSKKACLLGAGLVVVFMFVYYFVGGLLAVLSVGVNVLLVIAVMAYMDATFTLPGIAAIVLTVGMAVDANILIFERIREELRSGKTPSSALAGGFEKAFSTIIDANVTTLITAFILIGFGTGPVKGFGITLSIGIVASMFCALVVSRFLMDFLVNILGSKVMISIKQIEKGAPRPEIDFHKHYKLAFLSSWILVAAGITSIYQQRENILGIDFTGGEELIVSFDAKSRLTPNQVEQVANAGDHGEVQSFYRQEIGNEANEKLVLQTVEGKGRSFFQALSQAHSSANLKEDGFNVIGGSVSNEIQANAIKSVIFALLGILLYVALRFELGYAVGAVVATVHDVLMTVGLFVILGTTGLCSGQFSAPMLAAILMIVGYSINDTIVVFDRIREELTMNPVTNLRKIIIIAINRVLSRSILTSLTTLMAATSLWINGAGVVNDFAFVFVLGILTGTFSSIFIASPIFYLWHRGDRKHVEEGELLPKYEWDSSSKASR